MPPTEPAQIKRQLDALVALLGERRNAAIRTQDEAQRNLEQSKRELDLVNKLLTDLRPAAGYYSTLSVMPEAKRVERGHNRKMIVEILMAAAGPLKTIDIAKAAHEQGKIKSIKGLDGVYATVSTVLSRGNRRVFVNAEGKWDLKDRKTVKPVAVTEPQQSQPTMSKLMNMVAASRSS
jgi:hypothetical protein